MSHSRCLGYAGIGIRVDADAPHLDWLEECLTPFFEVVSDAAASCSVTLTTDAETFRAAQAQAAAPEAQEEIDCFALDSHVVQHPLVAREGRTLLIRDDTFGVFYRVEPAASRAEIVAAPDNASVRTPLMRVVREFAMNHAQVDAGFFLHASAFVTEGEAILVAAPKRHGKTSLLTFALRSPTVRYLSNDRVLVQPKGDGFLLRGMPAFVSLRPAMLAFFPEVSQRLRERPYQHRRTLAEVLREAPGPTPPWPDSRIGLSPAQYWDLCETRPIAEAPARVLLFPRIADDAQGLELVPVDEAQAAEHLGEALFGVRSLRTTSDVFRLAHEPAPESAAIEARSESFASRLACFECRIGPDAYRDDRDGAGRFAKRVIEAARGLSAPGG